MEINVQENLTNGRNTDTVRILGKIDPSSTFEEEKGRSKITSSNQNHAHFAHSVFLISQRS